MLNIGANDEHFAVAFNAETISPSGVIVPATGDNDFLLVDVGEVFAGVFYLQKFKLRPHAIQLHRKVLRLERDLEDLPQIANGLAFAERENRDFLVGIVSRGEKRKSL